MNHYVSPKYCIPFANGECASGETCPLRHDIFKCSCGRILGLVVQEKHMNSKNHSQNLAALQSQPETGDSSSPTISTFCVGYAPTARGKCQGAKPCSGTIIPKGGLQFGVFVDTGRYTFFSYRHWKCVKKGTLNKARQQFKDASELPGFERLKPADQAKVTQAWLDGVIVDGGIPESTRNPEAATTPQNSQKDVALFVPKVRATFCAPFANGHCELGRACHLRHDVFKCSCGRILPLAEKLTHLNSKNHIRLLANLSTEPGRGTSFESNGTHDVGESSQDIPEDATVPLVEQLSQGYDESPSFDQPQRPIKCIHCGKYIDNASYDTHVEEHLRQQRCAQLEAELEATAEDQQGVTISSRSSVDFGIVGPDNPIETKLSIYSANSRVVLKSCKLRSSTRTGEQGSKFSAELSGKNTTIYPGATRKVLIVVHPSSPGYLEDVLELAFYNIDGKSRFVITRKVEATVGSQEDHTLLGAKAPYEKRRVVKFDPTGPIVPVVQPRTRTYSPWVQTLPKFLPPADLVEAASTPKGRALSAVKEFMPVQFNDTTYGAWFQVLLYVEEEKMKSDLDIYALSAVEMKKDSHGYYDLVVQGLAENRPSVLVGDLIFVSCTDTEATINSRTWYEGRVHEVHAQHVSLKFDSSFSMYQGTKFDVRFTLNRLTLRRMHQILTNKFNPPRLLFPGPEHIRGVARVTADKIAQITPTYRPLGQDEEQMEAVTAIVNQKPGSVPFVIFGPPGTGKTVTIVEAIRQLISKDPNTHILACAPSNSAADNIAMKLLVLGPTQVFRLNALSRDVNSMPKALRPIAKVDDNSTFAIPSTEQLGKYRVVISTCYSGCVPAALGLKNGHFTHIFIDEAGQGREPELMVAIKGNANSKTNVILAGDVHQLGPIVHSPLSASLGLANSYLHRITQRSIYNLTTGKGITIVKLVKSFRSHPDIFQYSNDQFYNSELKSCGDPVITRSLISFDGLPKRNFPLIFHGIVGKDEREERSPSFFNVDEVTLVKKYCVSLIAGGEKKNRLKAEHIGIITPYHAQRCKISKLLHKDPKMSDIKVGSVEEFQGQERRVIIISTVRSNKEYIESDVKRSLGFVANKQRLNVALTRAQALLIVIGNPTVLALDPLWRGFLNFVHIRGGWTGKKIDWDPQEPVSTTVDYALERKKIMEAQLEETVMRLRSLIISRHENDGYGIEVEDDEARNFEIRSDARLGEEGIWGEKLSEGAARWM